jgi:hypothetical protein
MKKLIKKMREKKRKKIINELNKEYGKISMDNDFIKYFINEQENIRETTDIMNKKIQKFGFDDFDDFVLSEFQINQCVLKIDVVEKILEKKFQKIKEFVLNNVNNYEIRDESFTQYHKAKEFNDLKIIDYLIQMYCHFSFTEFENQEFNSKFMKENHYSKLDDIKGNDDIYLIKE